MFGIVLAIERIPFSALLYIQITWMNHVPQSLFDFFAILCFKYSSYMFLFIRILDCNQELFKFSHCVHHR
jgi:hypothetical protein